MCLAQLQQHTVLQYIHEKGQCNATKELRLLSGIHYPSKAGLAPGALHDDASSSPLAASLASATIFRPQATRSTVWLVVFAGSKRGFYLKGAGRCSSRRSNGWKLSDASCGWKLALYNTYTYANDALKSPMHLSPSGHFFHKSNHDLLSVHPHHHHTRPLNFHSRKPLLSVLSSSAPPPLRHSQKPFMQAVTPSNSCTSPHQSNPIPTHNPQSTPTNSFSFPHPQALPIGSDG